MTRTIELAIDGMHCGGCVASVTKALNVAAPGSRVAVDLAAGTALVTGEADAEALRAAIEDAGYGARVSKAG